MLEKLDNDLNIHVPPNSDGRQIAPATLSFSKNSIFTQTGELSLVTGLHPFQVDSQHTRVAKHDILALVIVKKSPIIKPLALESTAHWFGFSKCPLWKL